MKLINLENEALTIPDTEYDAEITMSTDDFSRICKEQYKVAEAVTIEARTNKIVFKIEGEVGKARTEMVNQGKTQVHVTRDVDQSYSLRHLSSFAKAGMLSDTMKILMSDKAPLAAEFDMGSLGYIKFYLAPKIGAETHAEEEKE